MALSSESELRGPPGVRLFAWARFFASTEKPARMSAAVAESLSWTMLLEPASLKSGGADSVRQSMPPK